MEAEDEGGLEGFMNMLLTQNPSSQEFLGDYVDFDFQMATQLQEEEEERLQEEEEERRKKEEQDYEFAMQLQRAGSAGPQDMNDDSASLRLAMELAGQIPRRDEDEEASLRLALELARGEGQGQDDEKLARELMDEELALKLKIELEEEDLAQEEYDRKLALKFVEEEKKEAERVKRAKIEEEEVKKGILPANQHVEDIISSHLEFLVGSDLGPFRSFCKKGNITLRVIKRPDLEERFRVKSKKMADRLGLEFATPVVAFHGTKKQNVDKIEKGGLKV
jgi:hypothetical protein